MANILTLATAGCPPDHLLDINHNYYPRVDYLELQRLIDIHLVDYHIYEHFPFGKFFRQIETQIRSDLYLAFLGLLEQRHHRLVFNMSERVGIPFSGLNRFVPWKKPTVSMFTCWSPRQETLITKLNLFSSMDAIAVHCNSMKRHFIKLGAAEERVHVTPYSVDQCFFKPQKNVDPIRNFIFSIGEVRSRNYPLLFRAVETLPVKLLVAASGRWYSREKDGNLERSVPNNVTLGNHFSLLELRKIYSQCQFVVLPIKNLLYSAGATAILEAMCMEKAVIVTRSPGIADYVKDGETGLFVEDGNEAGLRNAIEYLLGHPEDACRLGRNGRQWVEDELNLDRYVYQMAEILQNPQFTNNRIALR